MPVNEKALGYTIIFSVFALMSKMTCRWLLDIAYSVSGIPFEKIVERKQLKMLRREEIVFEYQEVCILSRSDGALFVLYGLRYYSYLNDIAS